MKNRSLDALRSLIRLIAEGAGDPDMPQTRAQTKGPEQAGSSPAPAAAPAARGPDQYFTTDHLVSARAFADELTNSMLLAFQTGSDSNADAQTDVLSLIARCADVDSNYQDEFPICTAVVLCAFAQGDLQNAPAIISAAEEMIKQTLNESAFRRKKLLRESFLGSAFDAFVQKAIKDSIAALASKKMIDVSTEAAVERLAVALEKNQSGPNGSLKIPARGASGSQKIAPRQAITSVVLHSVDLSKIPGAKKGLQNIAAIARELGETEAEIGLQAYARENKLFNVDSRLGTLQGTAFDEASQVKAKLDSMDYDAVNEVFENSGIREADFNSAFYSLRDDTEGILTAVENALTTRTIFKDLATGTFTRAVRSVTRTLGPAWNDTIAPALEKVTPYVPENTGKVLSTALVAAGSIGAVLQYFRQDPKLTGNYALRLALADALVYEYFTQWAESESGTIGELGELETTIRTMFSPDDTNFTKAAAVVSAFDAEGGDATGATVTVAG